MKAVISLKKISNIYNAIIVIACMLVFVACSKQSTDEFVPYPDHPMNDTSWTQSQIKTDIAQPFFNEMAGLLKVDSIDCSKTSLIQYGDSIKAQFPPNVYVGYNGVPETGFIKVQILHLYKKAHYILFDKPTYSNDIPLETTGQLLVRLFKNGKEITLAPGTFLNFRVYNTFVNMSKSGFYFGKPDKFQGDSIFNWLPAPVGQIIPWKDAQNINTIGYQFYTPQINWLSNSVPLNITGAKTNVAISLPLNYTNKNTVAYLVFKNASTVLPLKPDWSSHRFMVKNIPVGAEVSLVTLTKIGNELYMCIKDVKIDNDIPFKLQPEKTNWLDIWDKLNRL